jgi:hypothetical protein
MVKATTIDKRDFVHSLEDSLGGFVLYNKRQFTIPLNQRPWRWKIGSLEELWNDLLRTAGHFFEDSSSSPPYLEKPNASGDPHFLGTFIFEKQSGESFEVVDGQQRLTACVMMISILREVAKTLVGSTQLPKQEAYILETNLIPSLTNWVDANPSGMEVRRRLVVDKSFRELFDALVTSMSSDERESSIASLSSTSTDGKDHKKMLKTYHSFHETITNYFKTLSDQESFSRLVALQTTLSCCFLCVVTTVEKAAFGFEVFKSLNAKMTPLSELDKIKNELFLASDVADHTYISKKWQDIYSTVPNGDVATFLRNRFQAIHGNISMSKLYKTVRDLEINKINTKKLVDDWYTDAVLMEQVTLGKSFYPAPISQVLQTTSEVLRVSLSQILLLAAAKKYRGQTNKDFKKCAELTLAYCFRELTIGNMDTSTLEENLGKAARLLLINKSTLKDLVNELKKNSSDTEFEINFGTFSTRDVKLQFYVLNELVKFKNKKAGLVPAPHSEYQHIEHIMPKKFSKASSRNNEWLAVRNNTDKRKSFLNRLGNLLILEADVNKDVSNYDFDVKQNGNYPGNSKKLRKCYQDSSLAKVEGLDSSAQYPSWDYASIEERQKAMALEALKVWELVA